MRRVVCLVSLLVFLVPTPGRAKTPKPFPRHFLWGTAISGFQSEMGVGAPTDTGTDWWVWVRDPGNVGTRVSGDLPENGPGFYKLFGGDARLARKQLHNNALRLGIEWSRIFPTSTAAVDISGGITPGALAALDALADQNAVAHYRAVFTALRARRLLPMVTLNHFTLPLWIHEPIAVRDAFAPPLNPLTDPVPAGLTRAGWLDPATVDEFAKFAAYAGWKFGDLVDVWCTINEPVVVLISGFINFPGVGGNFPPGVFNFAAVLQAIPQLVAAHARAYDALHTTDTVDADGDGVPVLAGVVYNTSTFHPKDPNNALDVLGAQHADYLANRVYLTAITTGAFDANLDGDTDDPGEQRPDLARGDFIGINYYQRTVVSGLGFSVTPFVPLFDFVPTVTYDGPHTSGPSCPSTCTDFGWEIYPEGLREVLGYVGTLGKPVYITENGIADAADTKRGKYIYDHLSTLQGVIADRVADVRGYFFWSLTDNFEWSSGYYPKFGLFRYDPTSGKRFLRTGARPYRTIALRNGIPSRLVSLYGP